MLPDALQALIAAHRAGWGDPLRLHRSGRRAGQALDRAREVVAAAVGARPDEVVFTGSYPQASHAGVAGLALGRRRTGDRVVTTTIDHSSVLHAAAASGEHLAVPVDSEGRLDVDRWTAAVRADGVALAALQVGNHEVGTLQPVGEAINAAQQGGVP